MNLWVVLLGSVLFASDTPRLELALSRLESVPGGRVILELARSKLGIPKGRSILENLSLDKVSRTDAVLTRTFDPSTGREERVRETTIYLRSDLTDDELVLDLAHELTHAGKGPSWDPYDLSLTRAAFVKASIEGKGGELDALEAECAMALELKVKSTVLKQRCGRYLSANGKIERRAMKRDFYKVGSAFEKTSQSLPGEPLLSPDEPELFSSTGRAPYPVALLREYEAITSAACENTARRLASSSGVTRSSVQAFLEKRCRAP